MQRREEMLKTIQTSKGHRQLAPIHRQFAVTAYFLHRDRFRLQQKTVRLWVRKLRHRQNR